VFGSIAARIVADVAPPRAADPVGLDGCTARRYEHTDASAQVQPVSVRPRSG
jgi:hypothetical protein